ncbi:MAG: DUF5103 domain-containing protein [Saprospiraceae bacterium]|nr:MAG: DUF5103 domain-containing protein [Saprospiraceae bacterium]
MAQQEADFRFEDYIYKDNIRSVKFIIAGVPVSYPIVPLNSNVQLQLTFDDLDADVKRYSYVLVHCDHNWQRSSLIDMEYLDGFIDETIDDYEYSFKTYREYTHFTLNLPNDDIVWTKSGNYLLVVYDDEEDRTPAITRRFMVTDEQLSIQYQQVSPANASKFNSHHEFDFKINIENFPVSNPQKEIKAVVMQNGRWDNALIGIPPTYELSKTLIFDYQDKITFPAGKEFRFVDTRTIRSRSPGVEDIQEYQDGIDVIMERDNKRAGLAFLTREDINGNYVIDNLDRRSPEVSGDYTNVFFKLYSPQPIYDKDVFVVGAFTDWKLKPECKMVYNDAINSYVAKILMKQGFYNYAYATTPERQDQTKNMPLNLSEIEGDWYEAENEYTILIYYRPFGERYDQLIGVLVFNPNY